MSMNVVGTLVVPFGGTARSVGGGLVVEWDDSMNLDESGQPKSQWQPGDDAYLLAHHDHTVRIIAVKATAGNLGPGEAVTLTREELIGFAEALETQGLRYLPAGVPALTWKGNRGRDVAASGREIVAGAGDFPCLANCVYPVNFIRYRLQTPEMQLSATETFPIRVYVYYEELQP